MHAPNDKLLRQGTICKTLLQVKWKLVVSELQRGDDPELDKLLRERIRDGDPMAHLVKKKRTELVLPNLGDNEKMKESGFVVPQDIPDHSWLKRRLDAAPNRYGIRPGRHGMELTMVLDLRRDCSKG
ncbi:hypothetical protein CMV_002610 [Castanea mollissima]|uniref:Uncharacterized protein n=1 Tax=Castanea mollissima TaxID=60419 RepID=A0A8J4RXR4_9ROSI|nr:hypothetical protein CMV_002610 [Castanea mollissima]